MLAMETAFTQMPKHSAHNARRLRHQLPIAATRTAKGISLFSRPRSSKE